MPVPKKLLSIGHSYVVSLNRRLVNEMARLGTGNWEITTVAPSFLHGDLRPLELTIEADEVCAVTGIPVYFSKLIHVMVYGWQLKSILQRDWDLVHCWEEPYIVAGGQVAWWTKRNTSLVYRSAKIHSDRPFHELSSKVPLVYFAFQNNPKQYPIPFSWIEQYSISRAAGWICSGHTVADSLKSRRGYNLPMRLIPLGVDVNHFYPSSDLRSRIRQQLEWDESGAPVIGFLGRLVPDKGVQLLMNVLDRLETPWRALFVGTGPMEPHLRDWATRYPQQVRICTHVKHHEVPQYLNAMDLLCAPSQTLPNWREQFGRMLIEAFACGLPVIGSDSGEIPYVIQNAGLVVGETDEDGWVKAIATLLNSPQQRQTLGAIALERAHSTYAWPIIAQQHLDFFNELLDKKSALTSPSFAIAPEQPASPISPPCSS
jgi:glycosyltransferase involved in cell wall biosynthesis